MSFPHVAELRNRKFGYFQRSKEEMGELHPPSRNHAFSILLSEYPRVLRNFDFWSYLNNSRLTLHLHKFINVKHSVLLTGQYFYI